MANHEQATKQPAGAPPYQIERFKGNPLIAELPAYMDDVQLINSLTLQPTFSAEERNWPTQIRMQQVMGLQNFFVPTMAHLQLARLIDSMLREGYVGRAPRTAAHINGLQKLYENQKAGLGFSQSASTITPQLSHAVIGPPGTGKTTLIRRVAAIGQSVIYHDESNTWQIPFLHIETPHDGSSVKGLIFSIFRKIDILIPDANYYDRYAKTKSSEEVLINHAARAMHNHFVGMLVVDEIQNLENSRKGKESLMTLLVSASNELGVPVLFVGTNKANRTMNLDFRQARRSMVSGAVHWDRMYKSDDPAQPGEWENLMQVLWQYQWVKNPTPMSQHIQNVLYYHSQGIVDIAIKLFATAQWNAMLTGTERIDAQLLNAIASKEFAGMHPMLEALRRGDANALRDYADIEPLRIHEIYTNATMKFSGARAPGTAIRLDNPAFVPKISEAVQALGFEAKLADAAAEKVVAEGKNLNIVEGTKAALDKLQPPKKQFSSNKKGNVPAEPLLEYEANDYRNAFNKAKHKDISVLEAMRQTGAVNELSARLPL